MRHRKSGRKLNRTWEHRKAMFRNMARSLLVHKRIRTTEAKAKELRSVVDKLITLTKTDTLHSRRQAYKVLENHGLVKSLFDEIGPLFADVPGGYTRVLKLGLPRKGDAAPMAVIELTRTAAAEAAPEKPAQGKPEPAPVAKGETETEPQAQPEEAPAEKEAQAEAEASPETAAEPTAEERAGEEAAETAAEPAAEERPSEKTPEEEKKE